MHSLALQEQQLPRNESASNSQSVELLKWNHPDDHMDLPAQLFPFPCVIYKIILINNKKKIGYILGYRYFDKNPILTLILEILESNNEYPNMDLRTVVSISTIVLPAKSDSDVMFV